MKKIEIADWDDLKDRIPSYALVSTVDLVIVRYDREVSVLYGRCAHRGALMSDGYVDGENIICGLHGWDYRYDTGVSEYNNSEILTKFTAGVDGGKVWVDEDEIIAWEQAHPQPYNRDSYQGLYQDPVGSADEPHVKSIRELASNGLKKVGGHGAMGAMGVSWRDLPKWDDLQFVVGQLAKPPLLDDEEVNTELVIGAGANKPLKLEIPLFVADMSFGALSEEAKLALAKGAELAGSGICSGEGGMLAGRAREQQSLFLRISLGAFRFRLGQGEKMPSVSFQRRARRENRYWRTPTRC